jgi:hypothetical protein
MRLGVPPRVAADGDRLHGRGAAVIAKVKALYAVLSREGRATLLVTFVTCLVAGCVMGSSRLLG